MRKPKSNIRMEVRGGLVRFHRTNIFGVETLTSFAVLRDISSVQVRGGKSAFDRTLVLVMRSGDSIEIAHRDDLYGAGVVSTAVENMKRIVNAIARQLVEVLEDDKAAA